VIGRPEWADMGESPLVRVGLAAAAIHLVVLPLGHVTAVRSLSLALALAVAVIVWWRDGARWPPLAALFPVWLAAACLSLLSTTDFSASIAAIYGEIVRSALVYFVYFTLCRRANALAPLAWATAIGSLLLAGLALHMAVTNDRWVHGVLPALGDYATTAVTLIPLLVVVIWHADMKLRSISALALAGLIVGGYLTYSRGFWLTLFCAVATVAVVSACRSRRLGWKTVLSLTIAGILAIALAALVAEQRGSTLTRFADRSAIYLPVALKILHNPLTGTGYGHETDRAWYRTVPGMDSQVFHAHNIVLSYLDQMGPLGLLVVFVIFGLPARHFLDRRRRRETIPFALAGLALLATVFVKNNLDFFFTGANLWLFFAHLGIYSGWIAWGEEMAQAGRQPTRAGGQP